MGWTIRVVQRGVNEVQVYSDPGVFDTDGDGNISESEREAIRDHFRNNGGQRGGGNGGSGGPGGRP